MGSTEFKVGSLVLASFALIGYMSMKLAKGLNVFESKVRHELVVPDASGIIPNTAVKVAGVKVGVVESIQLRSGQAVVILAVQDGLELSSSAYAEFKTDGILGTKHIALQTGRKGDPPLPDGASLATVQNAQSLGTVLKQMGDVATSLKDVADAFKEAAVSGSTETPIGRIMTNLEMLTEDLAEVSSQNKGRLNSIFERLDSITGTLDRVMGEGAQGQMQETFANAHSGLAKFDAALGNINEITEKLNNGEGTVGRLINDEETINGVNQALENLNTILGGVRTLQASFDYHSEYLTSEGDIRSFMGLRLQPGEDRFYEIAAIQDPFGVDSKKQVVKTGTQTDDYEETAIRKDKLRLTAVFAKNFYDFTFKGGLIESTGGFGVDYTTFNKKLRLSAEVFDFEDTNLRVFARYNIYSGLYLIGGYNSVLGDDKAISSPFVGAGLFLRNEDLAALAAFAR